MAAEFDATEFVDEDLQKARSNPFQAPAPAPEPAPRAPSREEIDVRITDLQTKLADLKREQSEIERERAAFEETRRRQIELSTGREELIRDLSRGIQMLEEKEFATRRDAEQMTKSLVDLRECLTRLQAIQVESWSKENFSVELSRALGTVDHSRMEWHSARLKFTVLSPPTTTSLEPSADSPSSSALAGLSQRSFLELARIGLAFTWPVALVVLAIFITLLVRR